jgi:hypothetical protein
MMDVNLGSLQLSHSPQAVAVKLEVELISNREPVSHQQATPPKVSAIERGCTGHWVLVLNAKGVSGQGNQHLT